MKFVLSSFVLACFLIFAIINVEQTKAGKKRIRAILIGALLASKHRKKILPLPLPLPIPLFFNSERHVPHPQPYIVPVHKKIYVPQPVYSSPSYGHDSGYKQASNSYYYPQHSDSYGAEYDYGGSYGGHHGGGHGGAYEHGGGYELGSY